MQHAASYFTIHDPGAERADRTQRIEAELLADAGWIADNLPKIAEDIADDIAERFRARATMAQRAMAIGLAVIDGIAAAAAKEARS